MLLRGGARESDWHCHVFPVWCAQAPFGVYFASDASRPHQSLAYLLTSLVLDEDQEKPAEAFLIVIELGLIELNIWLDLLSKFPMRECCFRCRLSRRKRMGLGQHGRVQVPRHQWLEPNVVVSPVEWAAVKRLNHKTARHDRPPPLVKLVYKMRISSAGRLEEKTNRYFRPPSVHRVELKITPGFHYDCFWSEASNGVKPMMQVACKLNVANTGPTSVLQIVDAYIDKPRTRSATPRHQEGPFAEGAHQRAHFLDESEYRGRREVTRLLIFSCVAFGQKTVRHAGNNHGVCPL